MAGIKRKPLQAARRLPKYTYLGCPHANGSPWCYSICTPIQGHGTCGRVAPQGLTSLRMRVMAEYRITHQSRSLR